jgi:hypothetical protein
VTAVPLTLACWFNPDNVTADHSLLGMFDDASSNDGFYMSVGGSAANDPLNVVTVAGASFAVATKNGCVAGLWQHAGGVFQATNSRTPYLNGVAGTPETSTRTPAAIDNTWIGKYRGGSTLFADCSVAEAAIWNAALTADEMAMLALGVSPLLVRPGSLVHYWPIIGRYSPEIDLVGGLNLTLNGAGITTVDHPRVFYPGRRRSFSIPIGGGGSFVLTADPGSVAIAGTDAGLRATRLLTAAAGSVAIGGTAASLERGLLLTAAPGAYAIAGTAATLTHDTAGAFTLPADPGAVAISGTAATLRVTRTLAAAAGAYAISGTAATLRIGRRLEATAGAVVISGTAADLVHEQPGAYTLAAAAGAFSISGTAATLRAARLLAAASGAWAISGTAATLRIGRTISVDSGAFLIGGTAATLTYSGAIPQATSTATITGSYAPTVSLTGSYRPTVAMSGSVH